MYYLNIFINNSYSGFSPPLLYLDPLQESKNVRWWKVSAIRIINSRRREVRRCQIHYVHFSPASTVSTCPVSALWLNVGCQLGVNHAARWTLTLLLGINDSINRLCFYTTPLTGVRPQLQLRNRNNRNFIDEYHPKSSGLVIISLTELTFRESNEIKSSPLVFISVY